MMYTRIEVCDIFYAMSGDDIEGIFFTYTIKGMR